MCGASRVVQVGTSLGCTQCAPGLTLIEGRKARSCSPPTSLPALKYSVARCPPPLFPSFLLRTKAFLNPPFDVRSLARVLISRPSISSASCGRFHCLPTTATYLILAPIRSSKQLPRRVPNLATSGFFLPQHNYSSLARSPIQYSFGFGRFFRLITYNFPCRP